ncbi:helix-turn-helix transcriptional regulator [bacterium]|nr:helix-turn-helix transcriptional regulator [bacterium]
MNRSKRVIIYFELLGLNVKKIREEKGMSLNELALKSGIRKEYLKKIEKGKAYGAGIEKHLVPIVRALDTTLYNLFDFNKS